MTRTARPLRGKKLLIATIGVGTLTFVACGLFPGCNIMPPPPCPGTGTFDCYDQRDLTSPTDGSTDAAATDGSFDAAPKGD